ncbi:unnamed protein product [Notodromas monacha]|uniref:AN1-type domain-containing protein n=1 Tax=Notodromas monacha TaxID=399045 RepID=A0A7R9BPP9_9CRUS|nr:unnamed protein product [Notodromas monacha]CAG0918034.1 unnamed protein product [Notodromas monacha]
MEFPHLGKHCSMMSCNRLGKSHCSVSARCVANFFLSSDFLPVKCDACGKVFCNDHYSYAAHDCSGALQRDVQVPVCPLCGIAVPVKRGEQPDIKVGEHIDNNCNSDVALSRKKVYANKCSMKGCKRKEMVPISCPDCGQNFCLSHRLGADHKCTRDLRGREPSASAYVENFCSSQDSDRRGNERSRIRSDRPSRRSSAGECPVVGAAAAISRASQPGRSQPKPTGARKPATEMRSRPGNPVAASAARFGSLQADMSEDEALARALQLSMQQPTPDAFEYLSNDQQISEDEMLARALSASEQDARRRGILANAPANNSNKNCTLS